MTDGDTNEQTLMWPLEDKFAISDVTGTAGGGAAGCSGAGGGRIRWLLWVCTEGVQQASCPNIPRTVCVPPADLDLES